MQKHLRDCQSCRVQPTPASQLEAQSHRHTVDVHGSALECRVLGDAASTPEVDKTLRC